MSDPYIGQIQMFGFNFPPQGWAFCDGQLLPISQNSALFSLLGTTYGGDGETTFALPDLRGRDAIHPGNGPGLPTVTQGQKGGTHSYNISVAQLPSHTHSFTLGVVDDSPNQSSPGTNNKLAQTAIYSDDTIDAEVGGVTIGAGSGQSLSITEPFLGIYHSIALTGIFPSNN